MSETLGRYKLGETLAKDALTRTLAATLRDERGYERIVRVRRAHVGDELPEELIERFAADASAAAKLSHDNIVPILDHGVAEGSPYVVLPASERHTLRKLLANEPDRRLPPEVVALIGLGAARGLAYAHAADPPLIHRAISPDVLEIADDGTVQIADYALNGLLTAASESLSALLEHTCRYNSPDQAKHRQLTTATDIFSLGATLYEALAGRPAFDAPTPLAIVLKISMASHERLDNAAPNVPAPLRALVTRMLAVDPAKRPSASEIAAILEEIAGQAKGELVRRVSVPEAPPPVAARSESWSADFDAFDSSPEEKTDLDAANRRVSAGPAPPPARVNPPPPEVISPFTPIDDVIAAEKTEIGVMLPDVPEEHTDPAGATATLPLENVPEAPIETTKQLRAPPSVPVYRPDPAPRRPQYSQPLTGRTPIPPRPMPSPGGWPLALLVGIAFGAIVLVLVVALVAAWLAG